MHLIRHLPDSADTATAVAIGNFDGLHLGHQLVIHMMMAAAQKYRVIPSVLTFEPHPRRFFKRDGHHFRIERLSAKLRGFAMLGVERVFMPRFDQALAGMGASEFLEVVLKRQLGVRAVITGENFAFGHKRSGNCAMLQAWGAVHGVDIITVPPVAVNGQICSSSAIRDALASGNVRHAAQLLGRSYSLTGRVVHGRGWGAGIGFATANLSLPPELLLPSLGVYAVRAEIDANRYTGVANLGLRPTVGVDMHPVFEVHLFDVERDLYGKTMRVSLVDKLRDETKFNGIEELKAQIAKDCDNAKIILEKQS